MLHIGHQPLTAQPDRGCGQLVGRLHFDTQVIESTLDSGSPCLGILHQDQFQGRVDDGEVCVSGVTLGWLSPEQLGVELDRRVDVGDVEGKLDSGHRDSIRFTYVDTSSMLDPFTFVNAKVGQMAKTTTAMKARPVDRCCPSVLFAPLDAADAAELARGFAALSDPVRLRVLSMLAASPEGEVCVCDFVDPLGKSQPTVSHHLKILSEAGLVQGERRGKWVWYSLVRDRVAELRGAIDAR